MPWQDMGLVLFRGYLAVNSAVGGNHQCPSPQLTGEKLTDGSKLWYQFTSKCRDIHTPKYGIMGFQWF
jgi:hypothetical protein